MPPRSPKDLVENVRAGARELFEGEPAVQILRGFERLGSWAMEKGDEVKERVKRLARKKAIQNLLGDGK